MEWNFLPNTIEQRTVAHDSIGSGRVKRQVEPIYSSAHVPCAIHVPSLLRRTRPANREQQRHGKRIPLEAAMRRADCNDELVSRGQEPTT